LARTNGKAIPSPEDPPSSLEAAVYTLVMATLLPIRSAKKARLAATAEANRAEELLQAGKFGPSSSTLVVQFRSGQDGSLLGPVISLPATTGAAEMNMIVNQLKKQLKAETRKNRTREEKEAADSDDDDDEDLPFAFHVALTEDEERDTGPKGNSRLTVVKSLKDDVLSNKDAIQMGLSEEDTLQVVFEPQAVFKVRPVRRCSSTLSGESKGYTL
jgi:ribosome assembly protein 4